MRAAAVALVLIVGAAVVLWYGNTLNSWVLGGLIGGLAALLVSIPISLTLFSYLSRRHDEQLKAEAQEEMALAQLESYAETPVEIYETDAYMLPPAEYSREVDEDYPAPRARNLPVPASYPRLPATRQSQQNQLLPVENQSLRQRATDYPLVPERQPGDGQGVRGRGTATPPRRPTTGRQMRNPGFPGYQGSSPRGMHQTAALRAARQEAVQQYSDSEMLPTPSSRRLPAVRTEQNLVEQLPRPKALRPSRQLPPQPQAPKQYRPRPTVEGSSVPPGSGRALPRAGQTSASQNTEGLYTRMREPQTDQIGGRYPQTGSVRQQSQTPDTGQMARNAQQPQTGQMARNPQIDAQRRNPDVISGSLKNPLVRRAPYMYEDDPLRQELAQQIEGPPIRRSSRYLEDDLDED